LREILASKTAAEARPSVTELQRRSRQPRLHPSVVWRRDPATSERRSQPAVAESATRPTGSERIIVLPDLEAPDAARDRWHQRLGALALRAAALAGALVFGLTLGRGDTQVVGWNAAEPAEILQPQAQPQQIRSADGT